MIVKKLKSTVDKCAKVLLDRMVAGEEDIDIVTPKMSMTLSKKKAKDIINRKRREGRSDVIFPKYCEMRPRIVGCTEDDVISFQVVVSMYIYNINIRYIISTEINDAFIVLYNMYHFFIVLWNTNESIQSLEEQEGKPIFIQCHCGAI